jgi:DNA-binding NarL/FixJ family response regulator
MTTRGMTTVIVVQEHRVLREAVELRIEREVDLDVVASVGVVADALPVLDLHPDSVVILDQPSGADSCQSLMASLRTASPDVRAVMLLRSTDVTVVSAAVTAGIAGVLCSDTPSVAMVQAVRTVAGGVCVLDQQALRQLAAPWHAIAQPMLSIREREVLNLLAMGSSNAEIANRLYVSTETVKTHVAHVLRKLDVPNRGSAVEKAARLGLLV